MAMLERFKKHFIPHEGNEFKPHFFREASVTALLSLLLTLFIFSLIYGIFVVKTGLIDHLVFLKDLAWYQSLILYVPTIITDAYLLMGAIVVISLVLFIFIEAKNQHPKNIFYGFFLLALILMFLYFSRVILFPQVLPI